MTTSFVNHLAWQLDLALKQSDNEEISGFWCDGVIMSEPDRYYSKKYINDNRQTTLKAYVGNDGQTQYELKLLFGKKALSRFARDLDIAECIPGWENPGWFNIDTNKKIIEVQLY